MKSVPMDLVDNPVHHPLQEVPGEVVGLGGHEVCRCYGAKDDNLEDISDWWK